MYVCQRMNAFINAVGVWLQCVNLLVYEYVTVEILDILMVVWLFTITLGRSVVEYTVFDFELFIKYVLEFEELEFAKLSYHVQISLIKMCGRSKDRQI